MEGRLTPTGVPTVWAIALEAAIAPAPRPPVSLPHQHSSGPHLRQLGHQPLWTLPWHAAFSILTKPPRCCCNSSCLLGGMRFLSQDFHSPHLPRLTNGGKPCQDLVCPDFLVGRACKRGAFTLMLMQLKFQGPLFVGLSKTLCLILTHSIFF